MKHSMSMMAMLGGLMGAIGFFIAAGSFAWMFLASWSAEIDKRVLGAAPEERSANGMTVRRVKSRLTPWVFVGVALFVIGLFMQRS